MRNRLIRYELTLFRRSFGDAFGRIRDRILLAATLALALLSAPQWQPGPLPQWLIPSAALIFSFGWQRVVRARLLWLAQESVLAEDGLTGRCRLQYAAGAHALLLFPLLLLAAVEGPPAGFSQVALTGLGWLLGSAAAWVNVAPTRSEKQRALRVSEGPRATGSRAAFRAVLSYQLLGSASPEAVAAALLGSVFLLTAAAALAAPAMPAVAGSALAAAPVLLLLLLLATRLDARLLRFLPFAGYGPGFGALAVSALPAGCFVAAAAAIAIIRPAHGLSILLLLLLVHLAVIITSSMRTWLYPGRGARSVELQVQVELAALLLVGSLMPPLAVAALGWRGAALWRHHRSLRWTHL